LRNSKNFFFRQVKGHLGRRGYRWENNTVIGLKDLGEKDVGQPAAGADWWCPHVDTVMNSGFRTKPVVSCIAELPLASRERLCFIVSDRLQLSLFLT
jgi:hypothetical protein